MGRIVLYFGSFNPIHNGHTAVAGYVLKEKLCDELWFVVSPQNPFKQDAGLAPEQDRLAMAVTAVREKLAGLPVVVSDVEFSLPKPSYTIDTLRVLGEKYPQHEFSILVGGDILDELHNWKEHETLVRDYRFLVYPREEYGKDFAGQNMIMLEGAPKWDYSSTDVREALRKGENTEGMLARGVVRYIREHNLWNPEPQQQDNLLLCELSGKLASEPDNISLYIERGKAYLKSAVYDKALNDFIKVTELDPKNEEAQGYIKIINDIFEYRYMDYYNP